MGRGIPVLLRQYLKIGARHLAFNVDPEFHDTVDSLMLVDGPNIERRMRSLIFGPYEEAYCRRHGVEITQKIRPKRGFSLTALNLTPYFLQQSLKGAPDGLDPHPNPSHPQHTSIQIAVLSTSTSPSRFAKTFRFTSVLRKTPSSRLESWNCLMLDSPSSYAATPVGNTSFCLAKTINSKGNLDQVCVLRYGSGHRSPFSMTMLTLSRCFGPRGSALRNRISIAL